MYIVGTSLTFYHFRLLSSTKTVALTLSHLQATLYQRSELPALFLLYFMENTLEHRRPGVYQGSKLKINESSRWNTEYDRAKFFDTYMRTQSPRKARDARLGPRAAVEEKSSSLVAERIYRKDIFPAQFSASSSENKPTLSLSLSALARHFGFPTRSPLLLLGPQGYDVASFASSTTLDVRRSERSGSSRNTVNFLRKREKTKAAAMDAIKKKMQAMKLEKDNAQDKADVCEGQAKEANMRADKVNEEVQDLTKKLSQVENDLITNKANLEQANKDLEEREKSLTNAESEVAALNRKVQIIEEDLERSEERLNTATAKLAEASQAADESFRMCKVLENRAQQDEERMDQLTNQLKEARLLAEDADGKSDEVSRKLAFVEDELEVAEDRVKSGEAKIMELEEELKVVGNSLKSLEVSEEKANQRVEEFKRQLKTLTVKLKEAEARAEFAEKTVKKLQKEVDRLEDELGINKDRYKSLADEMDSTFAELAGY